MLAEVSKSTLTWRMLVSVNFSVSFANPTRGWPDRPLRQFLVGGILSSVSAFPSNFHEAASLITTTCVHAIFHVIMIMRDLGQGSVVSLEKASGTALDSHMGVELREQQGTKEGTAIGIV